MRNTSTAKVVEAINALMNVPDLELLEMIRCLRGFSINVQSFVLDRFLYAYEYLHTLGTREIFLEEKSQDFLHQCLIDFWESRDRDGEWR